VIKRTIYEIDYYDRLRRFVSLAELHSFVEQLLVETINTDPTQVTVKFDNGSPVMEVVEHRPAQAND
jgi:hypothetical protein